MNDRSPSYETRGERPPGRIRRWVKVLALVLAVVALIVVVLVIASGGDHGGGPAQHF